MDTSKQRKAVKKRRGRGKGQGRNTTVRFQGDTHLPLTELRRRLPPPSPNHLYAPRLHRQQTDVEALSPLGHALQCLTQTSLGPELDPSTRATALDELTDVIDPTYKSLSKNLFGVEFFEPIYVSTGIFHWQEAPAKRIVCFLPIKFPKLKSQPQSFGTSFVQLPISFVPHKNLDLLDLINSERPRKRHLSIKKFYVLVLKLLGRALFAKGVAEDRIHFSSSQRLMEITLKECEGWIGEVVPCITTHRASSFFCCKPHNDYVRRMVRNKVAADDSDSNSSVSPLPRIDVGPISVQDRLQADGENRDQGDSTRAKTVLNEKSATQDTEPLNDSGFDAMTNEKFDQSVNENEDDHQTLEKGKASKQIHQVSVSELHIDLNDGEPKQTEPSQLDPETMSKATKSTKNSDGKSVTESNGQTATETESEWEFANKRDRLMAFKVAVSDRSESVPIPPESPSIGIDGAWEDECPTFVSTACDKTWYKCFPYKEAQMLRSISMTDNGVRISAMHAVCRMCHKDWRLEALTSYHVQTAMLHHADHQVDATPRWQRNTLEHCTKGIIKQLLHFANIERLPHFFVQGVNLWEDIPRNKLHLAIGSLERLISNEMALTSLACRAGQFSLPSNIQVYSSLLTSQSLAEYTNGVVVSSRNGISLSSKHQLVNSLNKNLTDHHTKTLHNHGTRFHVGKAPQEKIADSLNVNPAFISTGRVSTKNDAHYVDFDNLKSSLKSRQPQPFTKVDFRVPPTKHRKLKPIESSIKH